MISNKKVSKQRKKYNTNKNLGIIKSNFLTCKINKKEKRYNFLLPIHNNFKNFHDFGSNEICNQILNIIQTN